MTTDRSALRGARAPVARRARGDAGDADHAAAERAERLWEVLDDYECVARLDARRARRRRGRVAHRPVGDRRRRPAAPLPRDARARGRVRRRRPGALRLLLADRVPHRRTTAATSCTDRSSSSCAPVRSNRGPSTTRPRSTSAAPASAPAVLMHAAAMRERWEERAVRAGVGGPPAVPGRQRPVRPERSPSGSSSSPWVAARRSDRIAVALADAEVADRPHVEPAELEHEEHLGGPPSDAAHQRELARRSSSSESRATRSSSTSPASTFSARSRIDAVLLADSPAARIVSTGSASTRFGRGVAVERRLEPTVDRARRGARQLLEADRPDQLGEVRAPGSGPAQVGGSECSST